MLSPGAQVQVMQEMAAAARLVEELRVGCLCPGDRQRQGQVQQATLRQQRRLRHV